ncbi:SusC/RagA family TonB-linked outer membrane protein [Pedobacter aquatilis]|uniref:SusC/RagA family TonB-linked outer membrane protein n=1 Tax=Pedobacter aquatilis TaxID=351343 RepID=UPI00292CF7E2|nr:SusC/RagA family TonB-linked outer membrane protein [Pedobacter aquatilis]
MKLTTFLTLITLLQVSATTFGQRISLVKKNITLNEIFFELKKQTGYDVFISDDVLKSDKRIDVSFYQSSIAEVFKSIGGGEVDFQINDNLIIVKKKEISFLNTISRYFQSFDVRGVVRDDQGRPIPGATIRIISSRAATLTDEQGKFFLANCNSGDRIIITSVGFDAKEILAEKDLGNIVLKIATSKLDEVIVKAYGTTSQRLSTGNISSISSKQIDNKPINNLLLALQGEVPGIVVQQSSGSANSGVRVQIQGVNSMTRGNDPLYVVDGVPYFSQLLPSFSGGVLSTSGSGTTNSNFNANGNPLNFINPNDIESVSILKDADATAIYGSRAANGAVLISTRKPHPGESIVDFDVQQGFGEQPKFLKMLNLQQYLDLRRYAYFNVDKLSSNSVQYPSQYDINGIWETNRETNWQQELIGGTAKYTNLQGSISGGSSSDQYLVSGTYHRETTVMNHFPDLNDQKGSFRINLLHTSNNQKFKAFFNLMYMLDVDRLPAQDLTAVALTLAPNAPSLFNNDGTLNWQPNSAGASTWTNPLSTNINNKNKIKTTNLVSSISLGYQLSKQIRFDTQFNYTVMRIDELKTTAINSVAPEYRATYKGDTFFSNGNIGSFSIEPTISYKNAIGRSKLDFLLGSTYQNRGINQQIIRGIGYSNDLLLEDLQSAGSVVAQGTTLTQYRYGGVFGRFGYNWDDRYLLSLNLRRDGSSRFGGNNTMHNFWSAAGSWIFSNESFLKMLKPLISFGKLNISYGTTGNDAIGEYQYLNLYYAASSPVNYQNVVGLIPANIPNPDLQWEKTSKLQGSIDIGILNDRITLNTTFYRNRTSNQLLAYSLPSTTGFGSFTSNLDAKVENSGLEITLGISLLKKSDIRWTTNFNASTVRNKLVSFPGLETSPYANQYRVGRSISTNLYYGYAEVNPQTGLYQYLKASGGFTSAPNFATDRNSVVDYIGLPTFTAGLSNNIAFKSWHLSFLLSYVKQIARNYQFGRLPGTPLINQPAYIDGNYWKSSGDVARIQVPSAAYTVTGLIPAYSALANSDASLGDASYLSLKNVSLTYQVPEQYCRSLRLDGISIFMTAQNLLKITDFKGYDPEAFSFNVLAPLRIVTAGVKVKL